MSKQTEKIKALVAKREQARLGGGEKAIEKQHARGKYTARERIDMLFGYHLPGYQLARTRCLNRCVRIMRSYRSILFYHSPYYRYSILDTILFSTVIVSVFGSFLMKRE